VKGPGHVDAFAHRYSDQRGGRGALLAGPYWVLGRQDVNKWYDFWHPLSPDWRHFLLLACCMLVAGLLAIPFALYVLLPVADAITMMTK
jgi:uncharacterized protein involved in cysteine biosynthesis